MQTVSEFVRGQDVLVALPTRYRKSLHSVATTKD